MTVQRLCSSAGISRQGYYRTRKARVQRQIDEAAVLELVKCERSLHPRIGTRKLLIMLGGRFGEMGIQLGRDRFFSLLRTHQLLVPRKRRRGPRTTDSRHRFRKYQNLLKTSEVQGAHQAWVSDLTYVRTEEGFLYVSLISDAWSRKIVGFHGHATLASTGSLRALTMALKQLPAGCHPIHHSDRGIQYCCGDYVSRLEQRRLRVSMTEENHCYENAQAERLNGILKQEYGLGETFRSKQQARLALEQAVWLYNTCRPHLSLGYRIPVDVHAEAA